jgi:hypothetical protein
MAGGDIPNKVSHLRPRHTWLDALPLCGCSSTVVRSRHNVQSPLTEGRYFTQRLRWADAVPLRCYAKPLIVGGRKFCYQIASPPEERRR